MYKIAKDKLPALYAALQKIGTLLLPCADKAGRVDFAQYHEGVQPALEAPLTSRSAKDVFFPQVENLLTFKTSECSACRHNDCYGRACLRCAQL